MNEMFERAKKSSNEKGITLVITTYRRNSTLKTLLKSLLRQQLNIPLELIIVNNYGNQRLKSSLFTSIGRQIRQFDDVKIHNLNTNQGCSIRYSIATFSHYETIMFLDDDIELLSSDFVQHMYEFHREKTKKDIISCWCAVFRDDLNYCNTIGYNFENSDKSNEVDLVGPGISMFDKSILQLDIVDIPFKYRDVDNIWFSIIPTLLLGSKKYYFPSNNMLRFVKNNVHAMFLRANMTELKNRATRELVDLGYRPLLMRMDKNKDK
jgi:glycosyltransferase involved in cell wall biosynthesis